MVFGVLFSPFDFFSVKPINAFVFVALPVLDKLLIIRHLRKKDFTLPTNKFTVEVHEVTARLTP